MWRHSPSLLEGRPPVPGEPPTPAAAIEVGSGDEEMARLSPPCVPHLVGLASTEARRVARLARLGVTVSERYVGQELWGMVLEQHPKPGASDVPDGVVEITVGARPRVTVPDLRGRAEDEALSMLRAAGLGAGRRVTRRSDRVSEGHIVRTRPRAGSEVSSGTRISYVIAAGPREERRADKRHGRREPRVARLADGSFLTRSDAPPRPR